MTPLELPYQLKGSWERALFMSYGAHFPFFERAVWPQFAGRCRQKIILLDGEQYLTACAQHAEDSQARHLNHRYVAAGAFKRHAVHAKMILLTSQERGRLLVGSGNLNWQGYASGGELFCVYQYDEENTRDLAAFSSARELLESLIRERAVDQFAARHVRQLLEHTPWIHRPADDAWRPVRHNLEENFLQQLATAIGGESVEELWVMSPFYDAAAEGLRQLLESLRPRETHLLVQPGCTSVDPATLTNVITGAPGPVKIHTVDKVETDYLHAKLYLVKTGRRAVCLQGSANLSQVAMLRTAKDGNVELCNLLEGGRDGFDYLLAELNMHDAAGTDSLELALRQDETGPVSPSAAPFYLTGGEWDGKSLCLHFRGKLPNLAGCQLAIGSLIVPAAPQKSEGNLLILELSNSYHILLNEAVPVSLFWRTDSETATSNRVFLYHHDNLIAELQTRAEGDSFAGIGDLDIDEDLEQLVADLENALVIDRRSVWRLAGNRNKTRKLSDDALNALPLTYEDIDYAALRSHPKTKQYLHRGLIRHDADVRNRLQIMLSLITGRFDEIAEILRNPALIPSSKETVPIDTAETEAEREAEEAERQRKRQDKEQRLRQIFKRFIGRYLNGIDKPDFQEFVGYEVLTNNYIIFEHLLWELSLREWFQPEVGFLTESQLKTWEIFWGTDGQVGYVGTLNDADRSTVLSWLREQKSDARLLAAVWRSAEMLRSVNHMETRLRLRDFWRRLLLTSPFLLDEPVLRDMWVIAAQTNMIDPPPAVALMLVLTSLANDETENEFLRSAERDLGFKEGSCQFELRKEQRPNKIRKERCDLCVRCPNANVTPLIGRELLERWKRFEQRDEYRISFGRTQDKLKVVLSAQGEVIFWDESDGSEVPLGDIQPASRPWDTELTRCRLIADQVGRISLVEIQPENIIVGGDYESPRSDK